MLSCQDELYRFIILTITMNNICQLYPFLSSFYTQILFLSLLKISDNRIDSSLDASSCFNKWIGATIISPVRSQKTTPNQSVLCNSNHFESSTPIKSITFDEAELDDLNVGEPFERPSLIKRNLLSSFMDDNKDEDEDDDFC